MNFLVFVEFYLFICLFILCLIWSFTVKYSSVQEKRDNYFSFMSVVSFNNNCVCVCGWLLMSICWIAQADKRCCKGCEEKVTTQDRESATSCFDGNSYINCFHYLLTRNFKALLALSFSSFFLLPLFFLAHLFRS